MQICIYQFLRPPHRRRGLFERLRKPKHKDPFSKSKKDLGEPTATSSDCSPRGVVLHFQSSQDVETSSRTRKYINTKEKSNERVKRDQPCVERGKRKNEIIEPKEPPVELNTDETGN